MGPKPCSQFYLGVKLKLKSKPIYLIRKKLEKKLQLGVDWRIVVGFGLGNTTKHVPIPLYNPL